MIRFDFDGDFNKKLEEMKRTFDDARILSPRNINLEREVMGIHFTNPIGIAAGYDPDGSHIMKKSQYSGMFGDYSSYSEEYEELADAGADEEESEDEE